MRRFQSVVAVLAVAVFVCSLAVGAQSPLADYEQADGQLDFAMVTIATSVQFWVPVFQGFKDAAAMVGAEAQHLGPSGGDIAAELDVLETLLASGVDGVAVFVAVPNSLDTVIEKYIDAGIPIVIMATGTEAAEKYGLAYIGQDNYAAGIAWGEYILELLGPDAAGKKVCFLTENPGQTSLEDRMDAGRTVLEPAGVEIDVVDTTHDRVTAYGAVESYYLANPDVAAFCAVDTTGSPVAAQFISNNGLDGKVFSAGFDLTEEVAGALADGTMAFTIDQHPYSEGFLSFMQLYLWNTLGIKPSSVNTGGHVVTGADVEAFGLTALIAAGYR